MNSVMPAQPGMRRKVIVDVDTGTDDAMALLLLLAADAEQEIQLLGVTCVCGNTSLRNVCRNTVRLLVAAQRLDIPVFAGAECSLVAERRLVASYYHGEDGFGDLTHEDEDGKLMGLLHPENAVLAMNRMVSENPGEVTLVCLAPLTNVALAIRTFPDFKDKVAEMHIMGGNIKGRGNITPTAEFNFAADPEAAHIVLESAVRPIQLTPWETTVEHAISLEWRWGCLGAVVEEQRALGGVLALLNAAERSVLERLELLDWVVCDAQAVACLLRPDLVRARHDTHASVELGGSRTRGQMVATGRRSLDNGHRFFSAEQQQNESLNVTVVTELCKDGFKDLLLWAARSRPSSRASPTGRESRE